LGFLGSSSSEPQEIRGQPISLSAKKGFDFHRRIPILGEQCERRGTCEGVHSIGKRKGRRDGDGEGVEEGEGVVEGGSGIIVFLLICSPAIV
jgi:hypothetical protein